MNDREQLAEELNDALGAGGLVESTTDYDSYFFVERNGVRYVVVVRELDEVEDD